MFVDHINNAVAADLKVGIYYYARATTPEQAQQEAEWVDAQVKEYLNGQCPEMGIWYDMEDSRIEDSGADITNICSAFIDRLCDCGFDSVGIYSSYNWLTNGNIDVGSLNAPIWCAQYNSQCDFDGAKIWQYTDSLDIGGKAVDGNEYLGGDE
jgi:GH25 family lysozyme M1 (1,4-beta-N-acetylmuramidase)